MTDEIIGGFLPPLNTLLNRISVQSGFMSRAMYVPNDWFAPGWNAPFTAEERKYALGLELEFPPQIIAFLERDDYDTALHDRVEVSFLANTKAAHDRLTLLIDLFKVCFPTARSAVMIRSKDNDRLQLQRVIGPRNKTLSTWEDDGMGVHRYTIRDLIEQLGPEPDYTLDNRIIEIEPKGERRRFRLPLAEESED